jgi:hypothetical protein
VGAGGQLGRWLFSSMVLFCGSSYGESNRKM